MTPLVTNLRKWAAVKRGEHLPDDLVAELMPQGEINNWGFVLSKLLSQAADEIERLRNELLEIRAKAGNAAFEEVPFKFP